MKKRIYITGIILCFSLVLFGLFYKSIDRAIYESIFGKPILTESSLSKLQVLYRKNPTILKNHGLVISSIEGETYLSYWSGSEGFTVSQVADGMYKFTFSRIKDFDGKLRENGTYDQKDANRVIDRIMTRKQKEKVLFSLE